MATRTTRRTGAPDPVVADIIRRLMKQQDLNVTSLAAKTDRIERSVLQRLVNGERRINTDHLAIIAKALGVTSADLMAQPGTAPVGAAPDVIQRYLEARTDDLSPRQRRILEGLRTRMGPGARVSEQDLDSLLVVVKEEFPGGPGGKPGSGNPAP